MSSVLFVSQKMWLGVRVMESPPLRRCCFQGTNLPWNGSVCTGWEPASITSGTLASSTRQYSVSPTPRRWPTTFCLRSTVGPVSTPADLHQVLQHKSTTPQTPAAAVGCAHVLLNVTVEYMWKQLEVKFRNSCSALAHVQTPKDSEAPNTNHKASRVIQIDSGHLKNLFFFYCTSSFIL